MNGENEYNSRSNAILMTSEATAGGGGGAARKRLIELSTFLIFFLSSLAPLLPDQLGGKREDDAATDSTCFCLGLS